MSNINEVCYDTVVYTSIYSSLIRFGLVRILCLACAFLGCMIGIMFWLRYFAMVDIGIENWHQFCDMTYGKAKFQAQMISLLGIWGIVGLVLLDKKRS
jgi:hypothetical protein